MMVCILLVMCMYVSINIYGDSPVKSFCQSSMSIPVHCKIGFFIYFEELFKKDKNILLNNKLCISSILVSAVIWPISDGLTSTYILVNEVI